MTHGNMKSKNVLLKSSKREIVSHEGDLLLRVVLLYFGGTYVRPFHWLFEYHGQEETDHFFV